MQAARYDGVTIGLHWATAVLVVTNFLLAEVWGYFPRPTRHLLITLHISFGLILTVVVVARMVWRSQWGRMLPPVGGRALHWLAKAVHNTLYVLLGSEILLGYATRWTDNQALTFFGLNIPLPAGHFSKSTNHLVQNIHNYVAWAIIILAGLHALAALTHHYLFKDGVLHRMLPLAGRNR